MPETPVRRFRLNPRTNERLSTLRDLTGKSEADIIDDAIAHLLGALEHGEKVWPAGPLTRSKRHKRPPDAA